MNHRSTSIIRRTYFDKILNWIGLDKETAPSLWIVTLGCLLLAFILWFTHGNIYAAAAILLGLSILFITIYRVEYGFMIFLGLVLFFDQYEIPGFYPITFGVQYFNNLKQITYLPHFNSAVFNPVEIQLILLLIGLFAARLTNRFRTMVHVPAWGAAIIFYSWFFLSFIHGMVNGGSFLPALWGMRALFYLGILYFLVPQIIRSPKILKIVLWICIAVISFKALQGIGRFVLQGFSLAGKMTLTNHEDPVFASTLIILLICLYLFKARGNQRLVLTLLLPVLFLCLYVGQRRASYASFLVSLGVLPLVLEPAYRWKFVKFIFPFSILAILYFGIFWNSYNKFGEPVQLIKSGIFPLEKEEAGSRYYSNLYRKNEDYDLAYTVRKNPVIGIGFGKEYLQPVDLVNISFPLRNYISHNQIFWIAVEMGGIGFFLFLLFFFSIAGYGANLSKHIQNPYLKAICVMIVLAIINQLVTSFYDLQLTYYRNMIYLGSLLGILPAIRDIQKKEESQSNHDI
jgi:hypothetical protein